MAWLNERSRNGGIDEVPVPFGRLWLAGKHHVAPEPDAVLERNGADTIVCLTEAHELDDRYPAYVTWLRRADGGAALWWPIPDLHAPSIDQATSRLDDLSERLGRGSGLVIHCGAGVGRAGTVASALLVRSGASVDDALRIVAEHRPMAGPESAAQRALVTDAARC